MIKFNTFILVETSLGINHQKKNLISIHLNREQQKTLIMLGHFYEPT